jgi:hypothetical protein
VIEHDGPRDQQITLQRCGGCCADSRPRDQYEILAMIDACALNLTGSEGSILGLVKAALQRGLKAEVLSVSVLVSALPLWDF